MTDPQKEIAYLRSELEKAQGQITVMWARERQIWLAIADAKVRLEADDWPEGLAAADVIEKYLVGPAVEYIDELEAQIERLEKE